MHIGARLKKMREERGLSLSRSAREAGIAKSHLWRIEHEECEPSFAMVSKIMEVYGYYLCIIMLTGLKKT